MAWEDKAYYVDRFSEFPFPETLCYCIDGSFYDSNKLSTTLKHLAGLLHEHKVVIVKPSLETGRGRGVQKQDFSNETLDEICRYLENYGNNFVIQNMVKQHDVLARLNPSSVNILRINTARINQEIILLNAICRFGIPGAITDISYSNGKESLRMVGIDSLGNLKNTVYDAFGKTFQLAEFAGTGQISIPCYSKVIEMAKEMHRKLHHFDLAGFDFTIDSQGNPICIEINLNFPGVTFPQYCNGPFFANHTEKIVELCSHQSMKTLGR